MVCHGGLRCMKRWSPLGRETVTSLGFKWVKYLLNIYIYIEDMYIVYNTSYIYTYIHVDTYIYIYIYIYSFQICYIYIYIICIYFNMYIPHIAISECLVSGWRGSEPYLEGARGVRGVV